MSVTLGNSSKPTKKEYKREERKTENKRNKADKRDSFFKADYSKIEKDNDEE